MYVAGEVRGFNAHRHHVFLHHVEHEVEILQHAQHVASKVGNEGQGVELELDDAAARLPGAPDRRFAFV